MVLPVTPPPFTDEKHSPELIVEGSEVCKVHPVSRQARCNNMHTQLITSRRLPLSHTSTFSASPPTPTTSISFSVTATANHTATTSFSHTASYSHTVSMTPTPSGTGSASPSGTFTLSESGVLPPCIGSLACILRGAQHPGSFWVCVELAQHGCAFLFCGASGVDFLEYVYVCDSLQYLFLCCVSPPTIFNLPQMDRGFE